MHKPVMLAEVLHYLEPKDGETYIDATFGAGGYTKAILDAANCKVIAIDQDPLAATIAASIKNKNFEFRAGNFGNLDNLVSEKVDGIIFDIGVSSMQIDEAERGFSFNKTGELDMRMSQNGISAKDVVNNFSEKEIADIIYKYGEEKFSRKIASAIIKRRPLSTTADLADVVRSVVMGKNKIDSVARVFQAIRIYVNDELKNFEKSLELALALLKKGGRLIVVTFHSLEDRIIKNFLRTQSGESVSVNRHTIPTSPLNAKSVLELLTKKAVTPTAEETEFNPRARSAKLRAAVITGGAS